MCVCVCVCLCVCVCVCVFSFKFTMPYLVIFLNFYTSYFGNVIQFIILYKILKNYINW